MRNQNVLMTLCYQVRRLAVLLIVLLASATASADDFKTHYDLALALYQAQKFEDAIPEFKAAYQITEKPGLLFNLAQAYRKAGHPREAIEYYDRYLSATPQLDVDTRRKVDGYLAEARNTLAALELEMKRRLAEEKAAHEHEPESPMPLANVAATPVQSGQPDPAAPLNAALSTTAPVAPSGTESSAARRPVYKRWWFWTIIGGVAAAGVITGVAVGTQKSTAPITLPSGVPRGMITF